MVKCDGDDSISMLSNMEILAEASRLLLEPKEKNFVEGEVVKSSSPLIPKWLLNVMRSEGKVYDPKLIIRRKLHASDLDNGQSRLSIPLKQVVNQDFLTEEETKVIYEQSILKTNKEGVRVVLVDPLLNKYGIDLRKWKIGERWNYVLVNSWNVVVAHNKFKVNHITEIWSFRCEDGKLCLAMSPLVEDPDSSCKKRSRPS